MHNFNTTSIRIIRLCIMITLAVSTFIAAGSNSLSRVNATDASGVIKGTEVTWTLSDGVLSISGGNLYTEDYLSRDNYDGYKVFHEKYDSWYEYEDEITEIKITGKLTGLWKAENMFSLYTNLRKVDLTNLDLSNINKMDRMFEHCINIEEVVGLDTSHSKNVSMEYMFEGCSGTESIDISSWNMSNVEDVDRMFYYCRDLKTTNLPVIETSNLKSAVGIFTWCSSIKSVDDTNISRWNMSNVTEFNQMFLYCESL